MRSSAPVSRAASQSHDITVDRSSYTDQVGLVAAGMGVSLLPGRLATLNIPGVTMVPLLSPALESRLLIARHGEVIDSTRDRFALEVTRVLTGTTDAASSLTPTRRRTAHVDAQN